MYFSKFLKRLQECIKIVVGKSQELYLIETCRINHEHIAIDLFLLLQGIIIPYTRIHHK
jgi:hypothetical protein